MDPLLGSQPKAGEILPPIEPPPLKDEQYDPIFHDCFLNKDQNALPDQEFIIHLIKKQLALKKKKMEEQVREYEENLRKEKEQEELKVHL